MEVYCANCGQDCQVTVVDRRETYPVRGEQITVDAKVTVCQRCHQDISVSSLDDDNLQRAFNQYRELHGLLTAEEIVRLRDRYQLSQRALAALLGWGVITIQRYENGGIQDVAHDQILRSLNDPQEIRRYLNVPSCRLSPSQIERLQLILGASQHKPNWSRAIDNVISEMSVADVMQGFRCLDIERLEQVVLWFAHNVPTELYKTKLAKLLWLSDFFHFRRERISLTGLSYARAPHGPIPHNFTLLLGLMESDGTIMRDDLDLRKNVIEPQKRCEGALFSPSELATLKVIAENFGPKLAIELSNQSHREAAWANRSDGELIPYTEADSIVMLDHV